MKMHRRMARRLGIGVAGFWLLAAAGMAGTVLLSGCNKIDDLTSSDDDSGSAMKVQASAPSLAPSSSLTVTAQVADKNGSPAQDGTPVAFTASLGSVSPAGALTVAGRASTTFTAGTKEGTAKISAVSGGSSGSVNVEVKVGAVGGGTGGGGSTELIDLSKVTWVHGGGADIGSWPVTAKLGSVSFQGGTHVCSDGMSWPSNWTKLGTKGVNANHVVLANIGGQWYGGAWEAMNPSIARCREMETITHNQPQYGPFGQVEQNPFWTWRPKKGEKIGFLITSWIRSGVAKPVGRSNVVVTEWPY